MPRNVDVLSAVLLEDIYISQRQQRLCKPVPYRVRACERTDAWQKIVLHGEYVRLIDCNSYKMNYHVPFCLQINRLSPCIKVTSCQERSFLVTELSAW